MRRLVLAITMASGLVVVDASSALAAPAPLAGAAKAAAGKKVCKIDNPKLTELSGIAATKDGFVVINDSTPLESRQRVFYLDADCAIVDSVPYGGNGPRDTEDLILAPDGKTLWIADIGDNQRERETVGLWSMPVSGAKKPVIHRLRYPDGPHDAEALLLNGDGTPIIVTKEVGRPAGVYVPTGPLKADNTEGVPLRKAGEITVPPSTTSTGFPIGRSAIDGGAVAPGGARVALRTYSDALEWDVDNGDVLAALKTKPRVTPLPDEPFGEAITYSADGASFLTVNDMQDRSDGGENFIMRYTPVTETAPTTAATSASATKSSAGQSWFTNITLGDITHLIGAVGVLGLILVGLGIFGIMRSRRRPMSPAPTDRPGPPKGPAPVDRNAETAIFDVGPRPIPGAAASPVDNRRGPAGGLQGAGQGPRSGVYGSAASRPPVPPGGNVYGSGSAPSAGDGTYGPGSAPSAGDGTYGVQPPSGRPGRGGGVYGSPPPSGHRTGQGPSPVDFFGVESDQQAGAGPRGGHEGSFDNPGYGRVPRGY